MVGILLCFGTALAITYGGLGEWIASVDNFNPYFNCVNASSIAALSFISWVLTSSLHITSARSAGSRPIDTIPLAVALVFCCLVSLLHFGGWLPVVLASAMMFPLFVLTPLTYRVMAQDESPEPKIFTMEEKCKTQDIVYESKLIRDFRQRYPQANAYMYKSNQQHTAGGILLHSQESIPDIENTFIEVTLNCPFTTKSGVFAEGKEIFFAYLGRHVPEGSIVSPLPQKEWQTWLDGLTDSEWYDRIEALDRIETTHPYLDKYPCQFSDLNLKWQPFEWT